MVGWRFVCPAHKQSVVAGERRHVRPRRAPRLLEPAHGRPAYRCLTAGRGDGPSSVRGYGRLSRTNARQLAARHVSGISKRSMAGPDVHVGCRSVLRIQDDERPAQSTSRQEGLPRGKARRSGVMELGTRRPRQVPAGWSTSGGARRLDEEAVGAIGTHGVGTSSARARAETQREAAALSRDGGGARAYPRNRAEAAELKKPPSDRRGCSRVVAFTSSAALTIRAGEHPTQEQIRRTAVEHLRRVPLPDRVQLQAKVIEPPTRASTRRR